MKWAIRWISLIHECILSIFYFKSFTRTIMAYSEYYVSLTFSLKRSLITYSLKQWILFFLPNQSFYFSTWFLLCRFLNSIREYKMNIKYFSIYEASAHTFLTLCKDVYYISYFWVGFLLLFFSSNAYQSLFLLLIFWESNNSEQ